jgi:exodeoxyribonuclease VII large subunit
MFLFEIPIPKEDSEKVSTLEMEEEDKMSSPPPIEKVLKVSELVERLQMVINLHSRFFDNVCVRGEVQDFHRTQKGHLFFSLKDLDKDYYLKCVWFSKNSVDIENGNVVVVYGKLVIYPNKSVYQIKVSRIEKENRVGSLAEELRRRYEKLKKEGLFDRAKRQLPRFPTKIGIVTSPTGAAIMDMIRVLQDRLPVDVFLYSAFVQGEFAAETIVNGIKLLQNSDLGIDVIIVGRGGGSPTDLITFSEEEVVRAIANSKIPIISAVGHEINNPLSDFAADERAVTPTEAAQKAVPSKETLLNELKRYQKNIISAMQIKISNEEKKINELSNKINIDPKISAQTYIVKRFEEKLLLSLEATLKKEKVRIKEIEERLYSAIKRTLNTKLLLLDTLEGKLSALNPFSILQRGYSIIRKKNGKIIRSYKEVEKNEEISVILHQGKLSATVIETLPT